MKVQFALAIIVPLLAVPGIASANGGDSTHTTNGPPNTQGDGAASVHDVPEAVSRLLELVNDERMSANLPLLALRQELTMIAAEFSREMAEQGGIWHNDEYSSNESMERLQARLIGENVAMNSSVEQAHAALMASEGHRANILNGDFTQVGMGVVSNQEGLLFVTQDFLAPWEPAPPKPAETSSAGDAEPARVAPPTAPAPAEKPSPRTRVASVPARVSNAQPSTHLSAASVDASVAATPAEVPTTPPSAAAVPPAAVVPSAAAGPHGAPSTKESPGPAEVLSAEHRSPETHGAPKTKGDAPLTALAAVAGGRILVASCRRKSGIRSGGPDPARATT